MGRVLGRHAMLHRRPEVDVEYGEEEQAVDDQGDDNSHGNGSRLSRGDHMISTIHRHVPPLALLSRACNCMRSCS